MLVVSEVMFENLHLFLSTFSKAGFLGMGRNILMDFFPPQRQYTPLIKYHLPELSVEKPALLLALAPVS